MDGQKGDGVDSNRGESEPDIRCLILCYLVGCDEISRHPVAEATAYAKQQCEEYRRRR